MAKIMNNRYLIFGAAICSYFFLSLDGFDFKTILIIPKWQNRQNKVLLKLKKPSDAPETPKSKWHHE